MLVFKRSYDELTTVFELEVCLMTLTTPHAKTIVVSVLSILNNSSRLS